MGRIRRLWLSIIYWPLSDAIPSNRLSFAVDDYSFSFNHGVSRRSMSRLNLNRLFILVDDKFVFFRGLDCIKGILPSFNGFIGHCF